MKHCGNCGNVNEENMRYCGVCGFELISFSDVKETDSLENRTPILETKIIQVNNDPSIINATSELWGKFGWMVTNVQVTHSQDTKTYTKGFSDYYTGMKTVETTTINYATVTLQRNKAIPHYQQIVELQNEYEDLSSALTLLDDNECPYILNIPLFVVAFLFCWPVAIYMLNKHNKEKEGWKKTQNLVRERSGNESQIRARQRQIIEDVSKYTV